MKAKLKTKLKLNDTVLVVSGKDKGKTGKILRFDIKKSRVFVEGVNFIKKTIKKNEQNPQGGIKTLEASVHISNVMYFNTSTKKACRIGYKINKKDKKERFFKTTKKSA